MEKVRTWVLKNWRLLAAVVAMVLFMACLLVFRLGTLNKGLAVSEVDYINNLRSGKNLLNNPTFLVHKLPSYLLFKLGVQRIAVYRLVSVLFAMASVASGFIILKRLYTTRIALLGSVLLLISAWILHVGRTATPEASLFAVLPLLLVASWLHTTAKHYTALLVLSLAIVVSFYIPGFCWLAIVLVIWERQAILSAIKAVPWWIDTLCGFIIALGLVPLAWAAVHSPSVLLLASGLPRHLGDLRFAGKNLLRIPKNLFVYGPSDPAKWLGRLPILDTFSTVMLVLGVYSLRYHLKQHSIRILAGSCLLVALLISAGGLVTITALVPLLYIFIGAGVAFMLQQWTAVFPRNPIARTLATTLMSITILLVSYYHISHYFIAWPQTPATKHVFGQSLIK